MKNIFILFILAFSQIEGNTQLCNPVDPSFGNQGVAYGMTVSGNNNEVTGNKIIVQPDNKIIQVGNVAAGNNVQDFLVLRYTGNGSLDSSFGTNGKVITPIGVGYDYAAYGALQADGKIVVAGFTQAPNFNSDFALVRYTANGSIDSSFGTNGKVITAVGSFDDLVYALSIQADGKIVAVGSSSNSSYVHAFAVVRYNSNGTIDSTFGQAGKVVFHPGHFITYIGTTYYGQYSNEYANCVSIQADGKIVVGGQSYTHAGCYDYYGYVYCNPAFAMVRYKSNGSIDSTFGTNGKIFDSVSLVYPSAMILQPDGKTVVTGTGNYNSFITERYNTDGSPDNSFGTGGKVITQIGSVNDYSWASSLTSQPDGKILVTGTLSINNNPSKFVVVRYKTNGSLDSTFNNNGITSFYAGAAGSSNYANDIALQGNKILIGGIINDNNKNLVLIRLLDFTSVLSVNITAGGPLTFCADENVSLTSSESGNIQWYKNNTPISGANNITYTANSAGSYTVFVNNQSGCGVSGPVLVTVNARPLKPIISWNGTQLSIGAGSSGYQWLLNGNVIAGANSNTFQPVQVGMYKVTVTNSFICSNTSDEFNLDCSKLIPVKPSITWNGVQLNTISGHSHYQWFLNGTAIAGVDSNIYPPSKNGLYKVIVTNISGCTNTSDNFTLGVLNVSDLVLGEIRLHCYPNPVSNILYVDLAGSNISNIEARLYDLDGRLVLKQSLKQASNKIPMEKLQSGLYPLVISNGDKRITVKVMVIR